MTKRVPGLLWISIAVLSAMILLHVWASIGLGTFYFLVAAAWAVILFGLIAAQRWAYVLTIVITLFEGVLLLMRMGRAAFAYWLIAALVVLPMVASSRYFYEPAPPLSPEETDD